MNGEARSKSMTPFKIPAGVPMLNTKNPSDNRANESWKKRKRIRIWPKYGKVPPSYTELKRQI